MHRSLIVFLVVPCCIQATFWKPQDYPASITKETCRTQSTRLCDPDSVIAENEDIEIIDQILQKGRPFKVAVVDQEPVSLEIAVALTKKVSSEFIGIWYFLQPLIHSYFCERFLTFSPFLDGFNSASKV